MIIFTTAIFLDVTNRKKAVIGVRLRVALEPFVYHSPILLHSAPQPNWPRFQLETERTEKCFAFFLCHLADSTWLEVA